MLKLKVNAKDFCMLVIGLWGQQVGTYLHLILKNINTDDFSTIFCFIIGICIIRFFNE